MNSFISVPYTYLIGWTKHNKWYYGVRYGKKCHPDDLWVTYFTSSKIVRHCRKEYGEPDIIEIRKTFDSPEKALKWETKVLQRINVIKEEKWLNITNNSGGINPPPTHKNKIWINNGTINKRIFTEHIIFYPEWNTGRLLGEVKFYKHGNRKKDNTGRFTKKGE